MGKRKRSQEKENKDLRKRLKKLEKKMEMKEMEERPEPKEPQKEDRPVSPGTPPDRPETPEEVEILTGEDIPEELILALGKEGDVQEIVGEELQQKLVDRWSNILHQGLGKEAREQLIKKYPIPVNFNAAVPPVMNQEFGASMAEGSIKRDQRLIYRQTLVAKIMFSLGKALTNILKGNLNTKELVEQISDSAKFAAEVYHQDSSSRKYFALAGTTPTIKKAMINAKTDKYLFGKDCAEKIKAAQTVQKTGSQIKVREVIRKRQENWKSPLQTQTQYRSGQPYRPPVKPRANQQPQRTQPAGTRKKQMPTPRPPQTRYRRY